MITRTLKKTKIKKKDDFLNKEQRKELKRILLDKFVKIYGLSCPKVVKEIVDDFFRSKKKINA